MLKKILISIIWLACWPTIASGALLAPGADILKNNDLYIETREQCESLGGVWEECPPNECQQTPEYQQGQVMCTQECGQPICRGIVPAEKEDLSGIHNPYIDQNLRGSTAAAGNINPDNQLPQDQTASKINPKQLAVFVVLGLLLAGLFIILKTQKKQLRENRDR